MSSTMKSDVMRFTLLSKNVLTPEESELYELSQLADVTLDPDVFKILLDLLKLNVEPSALLRMLKSMTGSHKKKAASANSGPSYVDRATLQSAPVDRANFGGSQPGSQHHTRAHTAIRRPEARR